MVSFNNALNSGALKWTFFVPEKCTQYCNTEKRYLMVKNNYRPQKKNCAVINDAFLLPFKLSAKNVTLLLSNCHFTQQVMHSAVL